MIDTIRSHGGNRDGYGAEFGYIPARAGEDAHADREAERNLPLMGLAGSSMANRFRAWTGASGRRYIFSIFAVAADGTGLERLPTEGEAVVILAEHRRGEARRLLWVGRTGNCPEVFFRSERVQGLVERGGCEIHVHLLAADAGERQAIVRDLVGAQPRAG